MNRLIIIGNGFDRSHNLPTGYEDFIKWYLTKGFEEAIEKGIYNKDDLIYIEKRYPYQDVYLKPFASLEEYIDFMYINGFKPNVLQGYKIQGWANDFTNPFKITIKSQFLKALLEECADPGWVDIENQFYKLLVSCLNPSKKHAREDLNALNKDMALMIKQLDTYLSTLGVGEHMSEYQYIFETNIMGYENINTHNDITIKQPKSTMLLNFNYTKTADKYVERMESNGWMVTQNHIHGEIGEPSNPIVFGYGDDLDEHYRFLESGQEEFQLFLKAYLYSLADNYMNLQKFINTSPFQVFVIGHSCGLSDRRMLNMIFDHINCKAIKIFYRGSKDNNDYLKKVRQISKNSQDKRSMQSKLTSILHCQQVPQVSRPD